MAAMLLGQNKETTATLEKLVKFISMKTKECSIGGHFESRWTESKTIQNWLVGTIRKSLNWVQNNTKLVSGNNKKALLIQ